MDRSGQNLEFIHAWRIAAGMTDVDDDQIVAANVMVDKERLARG